MPLLDLWRSSPRYDTLSSMQWPDPADQPGLEAVPLSAPEPVHGPGYEAGLEVAPNSYQPMGYSEAGQAIPGEKSTVQKQGFFKRRKKWIIATVILLIIAIAVGVGGGVSVSKKDNKEKNLSSGSSGSVNGTSTGSIPTSFTARVNEDAPLAMTSQDDIFFQDRQGRIIQTKYPEGRRARQPQSYLIIEEGEAPKPSTPLASVEWDRGEYMQIFYLDEDNRLRDRIWTDNKWQAGTLAKKNIKTYGRSQLAACRVTRLNELHLFYQQGNGKIAELILDLSDGANTWKAAPQADTIGSGLLGTGLAAVEVHETQFRLYFQTEDRKIIEQCWPARELSGAKGDDADNWNNCRQFASSNEGTNDQLAADLTPIAAARFEGKVNNTHVMYQSDAGTIVDYRWDDVAEIWQEVPPDAEKLLQKGKMAARVSSNNTIALIYHAEDGIRSLTLQGDEGWIKRKEPVIIG